LDTQIIAAHRDEGRIAFLQVVDHAGVHELTVHAFVGATGEADLASFGTRSAIAGRALSSCSRTLRSTVAS
jgi:hypothetical protein